MTLFGAALEMAHLESPGAPPSGYALIYPAGDGIWRVQDADGVEQMVALGPQPCRITSAQSTTSTGLSSVAGMSLALTPGLWHFRFSGQYTASGSGTGMGLGLTGPTLDDEGLLANVFIAETNAVPYLNSITAYNTGVLSTASSGSTRMPWEVWGRVHVAAGGDLALLFRSETNGQTVTIQPGSYGYAWRAG